MKMNLDDIEEIFDIIENSNTICIAGHKAPDGDCIGSVMALYEFLKHLNKNLTVYFDGVIPYNYKSFVDEEVVANSYNEFNYDLAITLDCSDLERLGKYKNIIANAKKTICIDHHKTNTLFCDINIVDSDKSSTGELLYDILKYENKKITKKMAEFIYIAIVTDTGKFIYSNTTSQTHKTVSALIDIGVDVSRINNIIYNSKPSNIVKAYIDCISSINLYYNNKLGIATITQKVLNEHSVKMGDIDGVVEFIREIDEVEISCVLKESDQHNTKVSLRSKNNIDVSLISLEFGGGGHSKAAGFEINDTIENSKKILINKFKSSFGE